MTDDTQSTPDDGQVADGQVDTQAQDPKEGSQEPDTNERLAQLERDYKELQRDYTRKTQQLKQVQRTPQTPQPSPEDEDEFASYIRKSVAKELSEFETRQEQRRLADEMIREAAEQHGIPVKDLRESYRKLEEAAQDPYELMNTVARLYRSDHVDKVTNEAKREVQRNARAVTTESGAARVPPPGKSEEDMTLEELREYLVKKHGETKTEY